MAENEQKHIYYHTKLVTSLKLYSSSSSSSSSKNNCDSIYLFIDELTSYKEKREKINKEE
ncbi:hypothetical protein BpHYR1_048440 [Brachionus plicatilis]|uniref:Uncharacterized protein n=1 Tax=Brachionus plicatilis TaxID=10195 RepID=A0A3M7SSB3_BRAPC|nr:hypothetical protein BpHYR1_048440 [Brachionus plicatilis]